MGETVTGLEWCCDPGMKARWVGAAVSRCRTVEPPEQRPWGGRRQQDSPVAGTEGLKFQTEGEGALSVDLPPPLRCQCQSLRYRQLTTGPISETYHLCAFPSASRGGPGPCSEARLGGTSTQGQLLSSSAPWAAGRAGAQGLGLTPLLVAVSAFHHLHQSLSTAALHPPRPPQPGPSLSPF